MNSQNGSSSTPSPLGGRAPTLNGGRTANGDEMKTSSISPAPHSGSAAAPSLSTQSSNAPLSRKRKYTEFQKQNESGSPSTEWTQKRMKRNEATNPKGSAPDAAAKGVAVEANCVQCHCGAVICD